jgi:N-acetylglucosaminyldiphosphoundecaprenol N-acetyl-beta-D-mannosaminyltransferase
MTFPGPLINIARVPIHALDFRMVLDAIDRFITEGSPHYNIAINAAKVVEFQHDEKLRHAIQHAHLLTADGQSIVWASKLLGSPLPERVAGADLMQRLLAHAEERGYGVYFLGAKEEVVRACVEKAQTLYPALKIVGYRNGYFSPAEERLIVEAIRDARPQILFLGFGSPTKEYFMSRNHEEMCVPFVMGVGGTFDVFAGLVRRAPLWMQRLGLEWFYRLAQEPRRMWKRYLVGNSQFIALISRELLSRRRNEE